MLVWKKRILFYNINVYKLQCCTVCFCQVKIFIQILKLRNPIGIFLFDDLCRRQRRRCRGDEEITLWGWRVDTEEMARGSCPRGDGPPSNSFFNDFIERILRGSREECIRWKFTPGAWTLSEDPQKSFKGHFKRPVLR